MYGPCHFSFKEDYGSRETQATVARDTQEIRENSNLACRVTEAVSAAAIGVSISDVRKPSRHYARAAFARQIAFYLIHVGFGLDFSAIGRSMGRNRTTIQYACSRVEDARDEEVFDLGLVCLEIALVALHETLQAAQKAHVFQSQSPTLFSQKEGCLDEQKYDLPSALYTHGFPTAHLSHSTFSAPLG
jgi:hypothetical protein